MTSVNMAEYIHVGVDLQWALFSSECCQLLLVLACWFFHAVVVATLHAFVAPEAALQQNHATLLSPDRVVWRSCTACGSSCC